VIHIKSSIFHDVAAAVLGMMTILWVPTTLRVFFGFWVYMVYIIKIFHIYLSVFIGGWWVVVISESIRRY